MLFAAVCMVDLEMIILSEAVRQRPVSYDITYMQKKKIFFKIKWTHLQNRNKFTDLEIELWWPERKDGEGRDRLGVWGIDTYMHAKSLQLCPTLCIRMDCSLPGSSVPGILLAGILEWVAVSFSRGCSQPRDWTHVFYVPCIGRQALYH